MSETGKDRARKAAESYIANTAPKTTVEIASAGEAGSAGKTTTLVTFAAMLAQLGFVVDIVDLDGQGNASKHLGIGVATYEDDKLLDLSQGHPAPLVVGDALLTRSAQLPDKGQPDKIVTRAVTLNDVRRSAYNELGIPGYGVISTDPETIDWLNRIHVYPNGLSYIAGHEIDFYTDQATLQGNPLGAMVLSNQVKHLDEQLAVTGDVPHFRFYDLHGTKSQSMMSALIRVTRVFNCVGLDDKTTGPDLTHLMATIDEVKGINEGIRLSMILPCRVKAEKQRGRHGATMLARLRDRHGTLVPDVEIREAVTVPEAYTNREPLPMWVPKDPVTDDYWNSLAWAFENGVFN